MKDKLSQMVQVKMDAKMRYMLELLSRKWHVTISEAIRLCLMKKLKNQST